MISSVPTEATTAYHTTMDSALGELTLVERRGAVAGVYFPHHWYRPAPATLGPFHEVALEEAKTQLRQYLVGERRAFDLPLARSGNPLETRVWGLLEDIPYGETITYGEIARHLANGTTPQEVGAAVGRNPLSILVPCHRVIGAGGRLTGYAGGLNRKRHLLDLEAEVIGRDSRLF